MEAAMSRIDDVRRQLDQELPRLVAVHDIPGASVAVLADGQQAEAVAGVVNTRTGVPVTPDSPFMIQSITKVWTATLVMQLVDEGLVGLDIPVREYLPGFRTEEDITVRHLLTHSGGFEGDIWAPTTTGDDALQRFVDDLVARAPQYTAPGKMYSYCSAGFGVLGRIVEVMRQLPYPAALRRHLAEPLGIDEIAFSADEALAFRTAIGHVRHGADPRPLNVWAVMPPSNHPAGNQLAMSARALLAFGRMHVADGAGILSAASARAMREKQIDHPGGTGGGHGLGWAVANQPGVIQHGGDTIGTNALLRIAPDHGVAIAMLTNIGETGCLVDELIEPLFRDLTGIPPGPPLPTPQPDARVPEPARYVGRYETRVTAYEVTADAAGRLWLVISARNEALAMYAAAGAPPETQRYELRPVGGEIFALVDDSENSAQTIEFFGAGRAEFLHAGRAARRI
jgi:CubicO group peptidase (beta-lactamase class C family)